jgi:hypothetical protein
MMKLSAFICFMVVLMALSVAAQADEHVRVSGDKYSATIAFGGPKVRFDGSPGTYAFLRWMQPVDSTSLVEWLGAAYVEGDEYAGFSNCPVQCVGDTACPCSRSFSCPPAATELSQNEGLPSIESTYQGVRIAIATGAWTRCFWYDKFAAYARDVLADPATTVENLTAACRLLEIVTGFRESDRLAVSQQVESRMATVGSEAYKLAPLLNAASLAPSEDLRAILLSRAEHLTLTAARMDSLLELAHLQHILGQDSPIAPNTIADSVLALFSSSSGPQSGGFRSDRRSGFADLQSTLAALEALDLVGGLMRVDANAVRQYVLDCWVTPGFSSVSPYDDTDSSAWACTDLLLTYAGTEVLAILENRGLPVP